MHSVESNNFSYAYLRQLLQAARQHFTTHLLSKAPGILHIKNSPVLFLRHDIKIAINRTLQIAEIEREYGLSATYMVRVDSPLYSLDDRPSRILLWELLQLGHEIGLHFDLATDKRQTESFPNVIESQIRTACESIEQIINRPIRSVSFHRPIPQLLNKPLLVNGRVNTDAVELRNGCISDANGDWHGEDPLDRIARPQGTILQLILHPIWWGEEHMPAQLRLQKFFDLTTRNKPPSEAGVFDIELAKTIPMIRRQGLYALAGGRRGV
jgi:hypothetical protein